ncbi:hypothetical protein E4T44_12295, partial [Aureobasidium sp. EXF-8845]
MTYGQKIADSPDYVNQGGLSRTAIFNAVNKSLKRLDLEYLDLLQIHRFDPNTPIEETMEALHDLVRSGKVRYIGASSMWTYQFCMMQACADKNGWTKFVSMQNQYSLLYREEEREMNKYCDATGVGLIPWAPLCRGHLARPASAAGSTTRSSKEAEGLAGTSEVDVKTIGRVQEIAEKKDWKMAHVALAWINKRVSSPIIGFSSVERMDEALDANGKTLTEEEEKYLEELYQPRNIVGHSPVKSPEKKATPKTGILKKTPAKSPTKRRRKGTPTPPPTARSSRSQSATRRPSVKLAESETDAKLRRKIRPEVIEHPLRPLAAKISSDKLVETTVPKAKLPRNYWIANSRDLMPPWISCSGFVPPAMVEFLMRCKKRTALGVKWTKGDKITNMEGAIHTFVTSIELAWLHGEKGYNKGHTFTPYLPSGKFRTGRQVLISNMIHQDFETKEVMMEVSALAKNKTTLTVDFEIPTTKEKQSDDVRDKYDDCLRRLLVYNLTADGELPSIEKGSPSAMSRSQAKSFLANKVLKGECSDTLGQVRNKFFWMDSKPKKDTPLLSLEILVTTAYHQFRNELDALERICKHQGYTYTFSAPKIFIGEFGITDGLMACIYSAGLKHYLQTTKVQNMR